MTPAAFDARTLAGEVARRSYGKLIAFVAARTGDVAGAEDAMSEAFAAALADWPTRGVPDKPEAWLIAVARRRLIDAKRRRQVAEAATGQMRLIAEELEVVAAEADGLVPDRRLVLMFACTHPAIDAAARAPLMLQTVLGFDAQAIASAFLASPATMSQRLVRAKAKIRQARIPLRAPEPEDLSERLEAVLDAVYAAYSRGWSDPGGADADRRNLADEAIWLARLVVLLAPQEPEALGLLALMLHTEARKTARRSPHGDYVPLSAQNPRLWDGALVDEAEDLLHRAAALGSIGRFQLEAAVQSAHAARRQTGLSDWSAIERLYDALLAMSGSPVVAINRAVAVAETHGAAVGLAALDGLEGDRRVADYQPYWACRAELLARLGRVEEADDAYVRAIGLEADDAVRTFLYRRRLALTGGLDA